MSGLCYVCAHVARLPCMLCYRRPNQETAEWVVNSQLSLQGLRDSHISLEDSSEGHAALGRLVYKGGGSPGYGRTSHLRLF